ncbi:hypothetical protein FNV43_RR15692 [Rhamnella rubrinervis]|uniref:Glycosyltransferase n=1 Tax=Rhamnella rubrinervis TaxID=2594499 RepID=A0A8K0GUH7_9ROSA|nr:hypothetical protein FNV43_RR15692 [Rhamnella rubrinervis]
MASQIHQQLHFLLVPLMSQSHLIQFIDMAKLLVHRGLIVTIVVTPLNAVRFEKTITHSKTSNLQIQFLSLRFPCEEFGLPQGCENMDTLPSLDLAPKFFEASNMLEEPLDKWLQQTHNSLPLPSCIVADFCLPWTANIAQKFNIPRVIFHAISCFTLVCSQKITSSNIVLDSLMSDSEPFLVPNIPDRIEFTKAQLPETTRLSSKKQTSTTTDDLEGLIDQFKEAELSAQGILVNTFEELEPRYVKEYQKMVKKLWCIGPCSMSKQATSSGNKASMEGKDCYFLKWLEPWKPRSVVYVCFGSLCKMSASQLKELALGLEASNRPFIWVIRKGDDSEELEKWFTEANYEERVKERGRIIRGWAPQVSILSHPATGGFLTHCGWNSTLEGISAGLPMITWPMFAEQFYNDKLIVQVLKTGVGVGVKECVPLGVTDHDQKDNKVMVKREEIKKAIDEVMDEGEEGEERRKRAWKLGEMAKRTVEEGGSSYLKMTLFIQHVIGQVGSNHSNLCK